MEPILTEGKNCWQIRKAERLAFLVDGAAYFEAFARAAARADRSILIACWDIDSRARLFHRGEIDGLPPTLWEFLNKKIKRNKNLHVHILEWDFAVIYAVQRELFPAFKLPWHRNRRIHFHLDGDHPTGGCHHQKVVVIDDRIAFVGGLDLTSQRWDTPEHLADDPRRMDHSGKPYGPFHDVQIAVGGEAAEALGDMFRMRWQRACGKELESPAKIDKDPWPPELSPDLEDVDVAVVRTDPAYRGREHVREVENLYLDTIGAAQRFIYIENQYFSSFSVGKALAASLAKRDGPEIVIVLRAGSDWLEEATMGAYRAALIAHLREADVHGRLRVYKPEVPGLQGQVLNVHSKVMMADGAFVRVGSANLSNRSMGVDTECDLALESSGNERIEKGIFNFQGRLLGEHLGMPAHDMVRMIMQNQSLIKSIEQVAGTAGRTLLYFPEEENSWANGLISESDIDPVEPIDFENLIGEFVPEEAATKRGRRLRLSILFLLALCGLAAAWRWTPLGEMIDWDGLVAAGAHFRENGAAPFIVLSAYVIGSLAMFPITLMVIVTAFAFGPVVGFLYAVTGCVLAAAAAYGLGQALGKETVSRLSGSRVNRLSRKLGRHGLIAVGILRIVPIAPFTIVNLVAGASHIRFVDFVLGTVLGMAPGIAAITFYGRQLEAAIRDPGTGSFVILAVLTAALIAAIIVLHWKFRWKL